MGVTTRMNLAIGPSIARTHNSEVRTSPHWRLLASAHHWLRIDFLLLRWYIYSLFFSRSLSIAPRLQPGSPDCSLGITSATGTRTRVARVRAEYPNQSDYGGLEKAKKIDSLEIFMYILECTDEMNSRRRQVRFEFRSSEHALWCYDIHYVVKVRELRWYALDRFCIMTRPRLEPEFSGSGDRRLIHWANGPSG